MSHHIFGAVQVGTVRARRLVVVVGRLGAEVVLLVELVVLIVRGVLPEAETMIGIALALPLHGVAGDGKCKVTQGREPTHDNYSIETASFM